MIFSLGVTAALAVVAGAAPFVPIRVPTLDFKNPGHDNDSTTPYVPIGWGVTLTCEGIQTKNQESWKSSGVGDWFVKMASKQEEYTENIQKTVQSWAEEIDIYGFHCDPMEDCSPTFPVDKCEENPINAAIYYILWSISYFNKWITSLIRAVDITSGIATGKAAKIASTFSSSPKTSSLNTSGAIIAGALLGGLGMLFPLAAASLNIGGLGTQFGTGAIVYMNSNQVIELEPRFNNFEDVSSYIADATKNMISGLESYAKHVLLDTPTNTDDYDYADDPGGLPQILKDGIFTESRSVDVLDERIYTALFSGAVASAWKDERAVVVKIYKDEPTLDDPPCEIKDFFKDRIWCNDQGTAFVLLKYPENGKGFSSPMNEDVLEKFKDVPGADDLKDFGLSLENVGRGSDFATRHNGGRAYFEWSPDEVVKFFKEKDDDNYQFSAFNLPVCDLKPKESTRIDDDKCGPECQILYRMTYCGFLAGEGWNRPIIWYEEYKFNKAKYDKPVCIGGIIGC